jgi:hypothetical protein
MTTPHAPDDERLPGEDELSSLYRKLPTIEPPAALDAAVRRAAAEAVRPPVAIRRRARWPVALSSAAALVIAAGLAWRMGQMPSKQDELREAAAQHEAQTVTAQEPPPKTEHEPVATPSSPPVQTQAKIITPPEPPKPAPHAYARAEKEQERRKQMVRPLPPEAVEEASSNPVPAPPPAPPSPPAPPTEIMPSRVVEAHVVPPAIPAPAPTKAVDQLFQRMDHTTAQQDTRALKSTTPVPAPASVPTSAGVMPAPMAPMAEQALPAPEPAIDLSFNNADTPRRELEKIRGLFALNQRDDARKRLADFHRDHPDYELPADLRDQLLQP